MKVKYTKQSIFGVLAGMETLTKDKIYEVIKDNRMNCNCFVVYDDFGKLYAMYEKDC